MPGAVDNEDYDVLNFSKGVYAAHPSLIPDGYVSKLNNFIIRDGIVEGRYPFIFDGYPVTGTNGALFNTDIPPRLYTTNLPVAGGRYLKVATVARHISDGFSSLIGWASDATQTPVQRKLLSNTFNDVLVTYNSVMYTTSGSGVTKLDVSNWPTTVTETNIASSPAALTILISHKSRLFGAGSATNPNRLYFTDAPAVGTLPETWNTTVNFVDLNGATGPATIMALVSLNNYIYIFTTAGLFSLYTAGGSTNWTLKVINPDITILNLRQVAVRNGLIYYVTETGVWVTDGFDFKKISDALTEYFNGLRQSSPLLTCLGIFNGGLLVTLRDTYAEGFRLFFTKLDNIAWTSLTVPLVNSLPLYQFTSAEAYFGDYSTTASFLIFSHKAAGLGGFVAYPTVYGQSTGGTLGLDNFDRFPLVTGSGNAQSISLTNILQFTMELETRELLGTNFMRLKLFKELHMLIGSAYSFNMTPTLYMNGGVTPVGTGIVASPGMGSQALTARFSKFGITNSHFNSIRINLLFTPLQTSIPVWNKPGVSNPTFNDYYFTLSQLGLISMIQRSAPLSGGAGVQ